MLVYELKKVIFIFPLQKNVCCGVKRWNVRQQRWWCWTWRWRAWLKRDTRHGLCNSDIFWFALCWWSWGCLWVQPIGQQCYRGERFRSRYGNEFSICRLLPLCVLTVLWVLEATQSLNVQPCVDKVEINRKCCCVTAMHYTVSGAVCWLTMKWAFRSELKQPANKRLHSQCSWLYICSFKDVLVAPFIVVLRHTCFGSDPW